MEACSPGHPMLSKYELQRVLHFSEDQSLKHQMMAGFWRMFRFARRSPTEKKKEDRHKGLLKPRESLHSWRANIYFLRLDPSLSVCQSSCKSPQSVCIGPWCVIDPEVTLGEHVVLESRVHVASGVAVGAGPVIHDGAILGNAPQDYKYTGEKTRLEVGENCIIREYCTLNRGTIATGLTSVGNNVLLMAYTHVAHDCCVEEGAVLANGVQLGGTRSHRKVCNSWGYHCCSAILSDRRICFCRGQCSKWIAMFLPQAEPWEIRSSGQALTYMRYENFLKIFSRAYSCSGIHFSPTLSLSDPVDQIVEHTNKRSRTIVLDVL
jgi:carbonic anhydrase/acetyltransferase-like protein (isoleucine patch superfamily)